MRQLSLSLFSALAVLGLAACSSADPNEPTQEPVVPDPMTPDPVSSCGLDTGYAGDENCLLPPDPEEGMQLHVGPSSYDDPDVINAQDENGVYLWLINPGDERTDCYHIATPNEQGIYYFEQQYRMRAGSHHMILSLSDNPDLEPGWDTRAPSNEAKCQSSIIGAIGGTQHVVEDWPPNGVISPEDVGLARGLEPHTTLDAQLHFYNTTEEARLREVWVNLLYKPKDEVTMNLGMLGGFGRMRNEAEGRPDGVLPHTQATVTSTCKAEQAIASQPVRVVTLFGHAHTHNERFAVFHDKADGSSELVYDSYDGAEAPTFTYSSLIQNTLPDPVAKRSGATSGQLLLNAGDQLRFLCDINNDTDFTFTGANEVNTDEMCNLFGSVAGAGFPCFTIPAGTVVPTPPAP